MKRGPASPEFQALCERLRSKPPLGDLGEMRVAFDREAADYPLPEGVEETAGRLGGRDCVWFTRGRRGRNEEAILYLHGGGFVIGSPASHRHIGAELCVQTGAGAVLVDYRLAPETPFPGALDDALAAYRELLEQFSPERIAVAGDSAGGGLAVGLIAALTQQKLPQPAVVYCMSPWVDMACGSESMTSKAGRDPVASGEVLRELAGLYVGAENRGHPLASPLHADLSEAPPMLIQVGSAEVLLDDAINLARALARADRSVRLDVWGDMIHVWQLYHPEAPEGREALAAGAAFIREVLDAGSGGH